MNFWCRGIEVSKSSKSVTIPAYFELDANKLRNADFVAKPTYDQEGQGIIYSREFRKKHSQNGSDPQDVDTYDSDGMASFHVKADQSIYVIPDKNDPSSAVAYIGLPVYQHLTFARTPKI